MSSDNEDEHIMRLELERKRDAVLKKQAELAEEDKKQLKALHWMHCAKCGADLQEVEFRGVKVDKCFSCGGVYLDDGELEQLAGRPGWFDSMIHFFRR